MRATTVLVPALAAALLCTGCGHARTRDPVAAAAGRTTAAGGSYRISVDFRRLDVRPAPSERFGGSGTFDADGDTTLHVTSRDGAVDMRTVTTDGDLVWFATGAGLAGEIPRGKTWLAVDLTKTDAKAGRKPGAALARFTAPGIGPTKLLDLLRRAAGGVKRERDSRIFGVHATIYEAQVDVVRALEALGFPAATATKVGRRLKSSAFTATVWVDDDGYVRKVDERMHVVLDGKTGDGDISLVLPHVGGQADIVAPPSAEVYDITDRVPTS